MAEKTRYSNEELAQFEAIINQKIATAKKIIDILSGKFSTDEEDSCLNLNKHATIDYNDGVLLKDEDTAEKTALEMNQEVIERQKKFIESLKSALGRIANKTYGICPKTGNLISKARLVTTPHATLSIEAKENQLV